MENNQNEELDDAIELTMSGSFPKLHERVNSLRTARGLSLADLVEKTKLSKPTLYRLIRGEGNPLLLNYVKLAECLGTTVGHLLGPQEPPRPKSSETQDLARALLADPPRGDLRAREIYDAVCRRQLKDAELYEFVRSTKYNLPGENPQATVTRAILDLFHHQQGWIDHTLLPRDKNLELKLQEKFRLPERLELVERSPVRVIAMPASMEHLIQIHAIGAMAAAVVAEVSQSFDVLGIADGFAASTVMRFLRRGSMHKTVLVPLTHTPRFVHYEMSGAALVGSMARSHYGYQVRSTLELAELVRSVKSVRVAVTSCGSALPLEPKSRLARLLDESKAINGYEQMVRVLRNRGVVGDLLYHFLRSDGTVDDKCALSKPLESAKPAGLYAREGAKGEPIVYSVSPDGLAAIAEAGVSLLLVHTEGRAEIACAAMKRARKPVNFIVTTSAAARRMLEL